MKNNAKRFFGILLSVMMLVTSFSLCINAAAQDTDGVIYLSDSGNDANDGKSEEKAVKTIAKAVEIGGAGCTVVVTDKYTNSGVKIPSCTLRGQNPWSQIDVTGYTLSLDGDVTIENITVNTTKEWAFVFANGHSFTAGEMVSLTKPDNVSTTLSVRGGNSETIKGNTNITLKSGSWTAVYGGSKGGADVYGNTNITIYGGVSIGTLSSGNDSPKAGSDIQGAGIIKLIGTDVTIRDFRKASDVKGGIYLDVSEYTGTVDSSWTSSSVVKVVKEKNGISPLVLNAVYTFQLSGTPADLTGASSVVYLDDLGNDGNDGRTPEKAVKTLNKAMAIGGRGCTVVIKEKYTYSSGKIPHCRIVGSRSDAKFAITGTGVTLSGDVVMENLTLYTSTAWSFINAGGNTFEAGYGITVETGASNKLSIRGGGGSAVSGNTNIILKSGAWNFVYGGGATSNGIGGSTVITLYDTASCSSLSPTNDSPKDGAGVSGNAILKLVGKSANHGEFQTPKNLGGRYYIDLTEYSGAKKDAWTKAGAVLIEKESDIPQEVSEVYASFDKSYDLANVKNPIFLSDSGSDANDGRTAGRPKKTLDAAIQALGESGGTVVITGTYTHSKVNKAPTVPVDFTSTSADDAFVFKTWGMNVHNTRFYNLHVVNQYNWAFILHDGTPLVFDEGFTVELGIGITANLGVRAGGDVSGVDITVNSGSFRNIYAGTSKGNVCGDAEITMNGGSAYYINASNDGKDGRILGNVRITLSGDARVTEITNGAQTDGYINLDICSFNGELPFIENGITVIESPEDRAVPVNRYAIYINGYPDGTFVPDKVMTRAEAITVLSKLCGLTDGYTPDGTTRFSDVTQDNWYARNVAYLEKLGMLDFYPETLSASTGITRGEFVKLISAAVPQKNAQAPSFTDVSASHPYYNEIIRSAKAGLVNGYPDGTFMPDKTLTRAEIVTILNRLSKRNIVTENAAKIGKFSDIASHWAASQIIAASCSQREGSILLWYTGGIYGENTKDNSGELSYPLTQAIITAAGDGDIEAEVMELRAKRIEEIRNTKTDVTVTGTSYYVSEDGDDNNDGLSPETAWRTLSKASSATLLSGDGVFFRRGDTFRGQLRTKVGVTYSAYGEGEKPELYGSARNYAGSDFWKKTDTENVWVSSEGFDKDVGLIVFDEGAAWTYKQIDGVGNFDGTLKNDLEMYHNTSDKKLYLYSVSDPNTRYKSCEIAPGQHGITGSGHHIVIDNLCIKYVGAHGIFFGDGSKDIKVQNCEMGWIGGMIQFDTTRYGNAVEVYISVSDYTVDNCYIYECFDAGVTHQYYARRAEPVNMENINYTNNVIERCTYNIEYINKNLEQNGIMKNVNISGNLLLYGGDGWGSQRPVRGDTVIMGGNSINYSEELRIYDNVIHTTNENCDLVRFGVQKYGSLPLVVGNVFIGKKGNDFGMHGLMDSEAHVYDERITQKTVGIENNTFIFTE